MQLACKHPSRAPVAGLVLLAALTACDIPTQAPILTGSWVVPVKADSISVNNLLPTGVTVSGSNFAVQVSAASGQQTLGQLCPSCPVGAGPKPAFTGSVSSTVPLPGTVAQATLASGTVSFAFTNNLGFDPIRPSATARGRLTLALSSNGVALTTLVVDGVTDALPSGTTVTKVVALPAGSVVVGGVDVLATIDSPAGDVATFVPSRTFVVTGTPSAILASQGVVKVVNQALTPTSSSVDISSVSADIKAKIQGATLTLTLANPFPVGGTLTLRFTGPGGGDVIPSRAITVTGGNQAINVALSKAETDSLLANAQLTVQLSGAVSGTAAGNLVTVSPGQVVRVTPTLALATRIGG